MARTPGERVKAQEIARRRLVPRALARRVITQLANAGLLTTARASNGGLSLARPSREISLLDVVQVMEGPLALNAAQFCSRPLEAGLPGDPMN